MSGSDLLSHGKPHTIIGAVRFHFRVRQGIGWAPHAMAARQTGCDRALCSLSRILESCLKLVCFILDSHITLRLFVKYLQNTWVL